MFAKQSTARTFLVGPILDADGVAKTDEAVGSIKVTKNGTVGTADAQSTLTHDHTGHYKYVATDGDDFDTLGEVSFSLNSGTNAMSPVTFQVVPANVYDSLVAGSDVLDVSLTQILDTALTETAGGYLAAALVKFLDVATPLLMADEAMRGTDSAALAATALSTATWTAAAAAALLDWVDTGRLDAILDIINTNAARLTADRAGYIDKLNVSGTPAHTDNAASFKATGFSTHDAAAVVTAMQAVASQFKATGYSTHDAAAVITALGTGSTLTACLTAAGFSTHDAAAVVTALGTGSTLTACLTAAGFSTHDAAAVVSALGTGSTLTACLTAAGFSTHTAANVVSAMQAVASQFKATGYSTHDAAGVKTAIEADGSKLDHLWETTEDDGGTRRFTENALEEAPGSTAPTAEEVADQVWDETQADHVAAGSTGKKLSDAGASGDPLGNAVPGDYASGTAGEALGYIDDIKTRTDLISAASIDVTSAVNDNGDIEIYQGDAYTSAMGNSLTWTADYTGSNAIVDAALEFWVKARTDYNDGAETAQQIGTVTGTEGTSDVALTVQLTSEDTDSLTVAAAKRNLPNYRYEIVAVWDDEKLTLATGNLSVYPRAST